MREGSAPDTIDDAPARGRSAGRAWADWRAFGAARFRRFHVLGIAQGLIGALSGPAITIPLLLALGLHPALASLVAIFPIIGSVAQLAVPGALRRTAGNLRGLVLLAAAVGEPRGLWLAAIVALAAMGLLPSAATIVLLAVVIAAGGTFGTVGYQLIQTWYRIVLPESDRRLVAPRLGAVNLGVGALLLLPLGLVIDPLSDSVGLWAYVPPLTIGGLAGLAGLWALLDLPRPGRVRVPAERGPAIETEELRTFARVAVVAAASAGLCPFLSIYAIAVLGLPAGYAIVLSGLSSAVLLAASIVVSGLLLRHSSAWILRASFAIRFAGMATALAAHPSVPVAPQVLVAAVVLLSAGDAAGLLATNERLVRLTAGRSIIEFQSRFLARNALAFGVGQATGAFVLSFGGYAAYATLFAASGVLRLIAVRGTRPGGPWTTATGIQVAVDRLDGQPEPLASEKVPASA